MQKEKTGAKENAIEFYGFLHWKHSSCVQSDYDNSICFQKRDYEQTIFECAGFGSDVKWSGRNIERTSENL